MHILCCRALKWLHVGNVFGSSASCTLMSCDMRWSQWLVEEGRTCAYLFSRTIPSSSLITILFAILLLNILQVHRSGTTSYIDRFITENIDGSWNRKQAHQIERKNRLNTMSSYADHSAIRKLFQCSMKYSISDVRYLQYRHDLIYFRLAVNFVNLFNGFGFGSKTAS